MFSKFLKCFQKARNPKGQDMRKQLPNRIGFLYMHFYIQKHQTLKSQRLRNKPKLSKFHLQS